MGFGLMRKLDKNHDGFLTREEFVDKLVEHVNVGDENKRLTLARQVVELSGRVHRYRQHDQHNRDTKDDVDESWRGDRAEHSAGGGVAAASSRRRCRGVAVASRRRRHGGVAAASRRRCGVRTVGMLWRRPLSKRN